MGYFKRIKGFFSNNQESSISAPKLAFADTDSQFYKTIHVAPEADYAKRRNALAGQTPPPSFFSRNPTSPKQGLLHKLKCKPLQADKNQTSYSKQKTTGNRGVEFHDFKFPLSEAGL